MATHPDDGKFVVVRNGQRVSGTLHEDENKAKAEAEALKQKLPVVEGSQAPASAPKVVKNLYG